MIFNSGGPVYKQTSVGSKPVVKKPQEEPQKPKDIEDKQVVAEDKKELVKAPRKSKAKTKKED